MDEKKHLFQKAQEEKYAIGSFNFSTLEQLKGIVEALETFGGAPAIISTSEGEAEFIGMEMAVSLVEFFRQKKGLALLLNLDHGKDIAKIKKAIEIGYDMVHFDGSGLSFEENLKRTKEVVEYAHQRGVLVEGELGYLRGSSSFHQEQPEIRPEDLTDPQKAQEFCANTGIDLLAIAVGNIHGVFKQGNPQLDIRRIEEIKARTEAYLVLHGGSGIEKEMVQQAIRAGIVKININTELRLAYSQKLREELVANPQEVTPYKYLPETIKAVAKVVGEKLTLFSGGRTS